MDVVERFKKYVRVNTQSDANNPNCPSTKGQLELAKIVASDMKEIGIEDVRMDSNGYVYGKIKSNIDRQVPTIGFIAHFDTSPDISGENVDPKQFVYQGGDIKLNEDYTMKVSDFPFLEDLVGQELITTDGTTLLGADDKAGVAEILDACQYIINNKDIEHGDIMIGFTPDEEIGRGANLFNVEEFGADFAYTLDGGPLGELEYENFNAASASISIRGENAHPGSAKGAMINAIQIAMELHAMLPVNERPEYTEGYEGFYLLMDFNGTVGHANMDYIIRDHSKEKFEDKKQLLNSVVEFLNEKYDNRLEITIKDSYYNMKEKIEPHMHIIDLARRSMIELEIEPDIKAIRGGTDGARLSFKGLPCPNLFAGGYNFHGRFEFIPVNSLRLASDLIVRIVENNTK